MTKNSYNLSDKKIVNSLTIERLSSYKNSEYSDSKNQLSMYSWNSALCAALYPWLSMLEVSLRNAMDKAIRDDRNNDHWFDLPYFDNLPIEEAKKKILTQNKEITPGRIIAELNFGYWTRLFSTRYETKQVIWPRLIKPIFPDLPKALCVRESLSKRIQDLRKLRNRVYHYEPIWHFNLNQNFIELQEIIGGINSALIPYLNLTCNFEMLLKNGAEPFLNKLNTIL